VESRRRPRHRRGQPHDDCPIRHLPLHQQLPESYFPDHGDQVGSEREVQMPRGIDGTVRGVGRESQKPTRLVLHW